MFIKTRIVLAVAMILDIAVTASAATKDETKNGQAPLRRSPGQTTASHSPSYIDSNEPAAAGGGSIGYNRNQFDDAW